MQRGDRSDGVTRQLGAGARGSLRRVLRRSGALCGVALALVVTVPAMASAASGPAAPGLSPAQPGPGGYFHYSLAPGASASGSVVVSNPGSLDAHYNLYAAATSTAPTGGVDYGQSTSSGAGSAAWVRLATTSVTLAAHHGDPISFTTTVPAGTKPGQYVTAIVAQSPNEPDRSNATQGASVALQMSARDVVAVVVDVPGPASAGVRVGRPQIRTSQHVRQLLAVPMSDTGALLEKPTFSATVRACGSADGPVLAGAARQLDTFVPHTAIAYPWYLVHPLGAGCYHVRVSLSVAGTPGARSRFTGDITVGAAQANLAPTSPAQGHFPLPLAAADAVVLMGLGTVLLVVVRRGRRHAG